MDRKYVFAGLAAAVFVSACKTVAGPGDERVEARVACGASMAASGCAPDTGDEFDLDRRNFRVGLAADGQPEVRQWLGTVVQDDAPTTGRRGTPCGGTGTNPFTNQDVRGLRESDVPLTYERNRSAKKVVSFTVSASLAADLKAALIDAGVPSAVTDRLDAQFNAAASRARSATFEVSGSFRQYQIDPTILNLIDSSNTPERFQPCLGELQTGNWRMYEAMTGWLVTKAALDSTTVDKITAGLAAAVSTELARSQETAVSSQTPPTLASIKATLDSTVTESISISDSPNFLILGLSFWRPQREAARTGP